MALILLLLPFVVSAHKFTNKTCNQIKVGDSFYDRHMIWGISGRPFNLNVHRGTNVLYFSYSLIDGWADVDFHLAYVDIDTKETQAIAGIRGGCAVAINQASDDIFLGGSEGIYKYNLLTKIADYYAEKGKNVWSLFYNKNLFFISYPDQKLHIEAEGKFVRVKEFAGFEIDHFHVNKQGLIYFANKTGLYVYEIIKMRVKVINDLISVRQIVEDLEGTLYVCASLGIYIINTETNELSKVANIKNIHGLAFDKENNVIYSDEKSIILLRIGERC